VVKYIPLILRAVLTVTLLYFVWRNSHWSVALSLTLISIEIEAQNYNIRKLTEE